jgi:hypothetical protein
LKNWNRIRKHCVKSIHVTVARLSEVIVYQV